MTNGQQAIIMVLFGGVTVIPILIGLCSASLRNAAIFGLVVSVLATMVLAPGFAWPASRAISSALGGPVLAAIGYGIKRAVKGLGSLRNHIKAKEQEAVDNYMKEQEAIDRSRMST